MRTLLVLVLCLCAIVGQAATPSTKSFRGAGGILVTSNDVTSIIIIDGGSITSPTGGVSAATATNIAVYVTTNTPAKVALPISSIQFNSNGVMQGSTGFVFTNGNVGIGGAVPPTNALVVVGPSLATPATPTVTPAGTTGAATWTYKVVAVLGDGRRTQLSAAGTTTTGNANLTGIAFNGISWSAYSGAVNYTVYRTVSGGTPATTGLLVTQTGTTLNDTGLPSASGIDIPTLAENGMVRATGLRIGEYSGDQLARVGIQGDLSVNGSVRSTGVDDWKTGSGLELQYVNQLGLLIAFDRDASQFKPIILNYGGTATVGPVIVGQGAADGTHMFIVAGASLISGDFHVMSGNVGIGTLTTANKLDVEGRVAIGATYSGTSVAPVNGAIIEGAVGIGTPSPTTTLDVKGSGSTTGFGLGVRNSLDQWVIITRDDGNIGIGGTVTPAAKVDIIGVQNTYLFRINTNNLVVTNGYVGIGTHAPSNLLQLEASAPVLKINTTAVNPKLRMSYDAIAGDYGEIIYDYTEAALKLDTYFHGDQDYGAIVFRRNIGTAALPTNSATMTISGTGKVGIGTPAPSSSLDVTGQMRAASAIFTNSITTEGTITANQLNAGTIKASGSAGINNLYVTNGLFFGSSLVGITNTLFGSASLDFPSTLAGTSSDLPITVTGVVSNNCHVSLCVPWEAASGGGIFTHFESNGAVYIRFSNNQLTMAIDPTPATFSALVFRAQ